MTSAIAAAAALVGSSPGGSSAMPMTTLSFLPCARLGSGVAANAAATAKMVNFFSIFAPPNYLRQFSAVPRKRLTPLRRDLRQRHHGLGVVACGKVRRADIA